MHDEVNNFKAYTGDNLVGNNNLPSQAEKKIDMSYTLDLDLTPILEHSLASYYMFYRYSNMGS